MRERAAARYYPPMGRTRCRGSVTLKQEEDYGFTLAQPENLEWVELKRPGEIDGCTG
jgi:hypothetical protein